MRLWKGLTLCWQLIIRQAAKITKAIDVKKFEILLKFKECNSQCQEMSFVQMAFNQKNIKPSHKKSVYSDIIEKCIILKAWYCADNT